MDNSRAQQLAADLQGREIGGWTVQEFLGAGKSAVVVRATKDELSAALKIFDPELVNKFGEDDQLERIHREIQLKGHDHPSLVEILDGGLCPLTGHVYVIMGLISGPILSRVISEVPRSMIGEVMKQLASAAEFLESKELAHRDIKPDNIAIDLSSGACRLLDLGVLRPTGGSDITDSSNQLPFIGTLRYSSPEFLFRQEDGTPLGWRAITFYQLGGVLHDLIMRRPLFDDFTEPYARLVEAVKNEIPRVQAADVPPNLLLLAQNCLVKNPLLRLKLVTWDSFRQSGSNIFSVASTRERIANRRELLSDSAFRGKARGSQEHWLESAIIVNIKEELAKLIRVICVTSKLFPPLELHSMSLNSGASDDSSRHRFVEALLLRFAKTSAHYLDKPLSVLFQIDLLDSTVRAVEIRAGAALGEVTADDLVEGLSIFKGVLLEEQLLPVIEAVLLTVLDTAQQLFGVPDPEGAAFQRLAIRNPIVGDQ